MSTLAAHDRAELTRWQRWSLLVGIVALVICVVGAFFDPDQFYRAYLASYIFYWGIALGSLAILMIYHLTGGAWGFLIRRILEAATRTLPLVAIGFTPIAIGIGSLYRWAQPELVAHNEKLQHQQAYLNPGFFWGRVAIYFAIWIGLMVVFNVWSRAEDRSGEERYLWRQGKLAGFGLVLYGVTMHFAATDWILSIQSEIHSTIFPPLVVLGQLLSAHALALVVFARLTARPPLAEALSLKALNDLGNLLFTFLIIWAYMVWFQFMLIWIANMPGDVIWYLPRDRAGWQYVAWALFLFHFVLPFFLLLTRKVKRTPILTARVAGLLLFMQLIHGYYLVEPPYYADAIAQHWMDFLMPVALGGPWLAFFLWQVARAPLLPRHDMNAEEALHLRELDEEEAEREEALAHG
jgi:hypothetical protein